MKWLTWLASRLHRIIVAYVLTLLLCAGCMVALEGLSPVDALWYCGVTSLTIGYGDIAAKTEAGRLIVMLFAHFWVFVIGPVVVANIITGVIQDRDEWTHEEQEEIKNLLRQIGKQNTLSEHKHMGVKECHYQ